LGQHDALSVGHELIEFAAENAYEMFEFGKVLNRYIAETKEVNKMLFKDYNTKYRISILKKTFEFLCMF